MNAEDVINHTEASFRHARNGATRMQPELSEAGEIEKETEVKKAMKLTDLKIPGPSVNAFVCGFVFMRFIVALKDTPVIPLLTRRERHSSLQVSLIHPPQKCQRRPARPSVCLWWQNAERMKCPLSCHSHLSHIYFTLYFVSQLPRAPWGILGGKDDGFWILCFSCLEQ